MRILILRVGLFITVMSLAILFPGCKSQNAQVNDPPHFVTQAAAPVTTDSVEVTQEPIEETNSVPPAPEPLVIELSESVAEVVKLAQSGMGEKVMLAFIETYPNPFDLKAPEIVYLADLGISEGAISAMIKHQSGIEAVTEAAPESIEQTEGNTNIVSDVTAPEPVQERPLPSEDGEEPAQTPESVEPSVSITAAPEFATSSESVAPSGEDAVAPVESAHFYSALEPYGSWTDVPGYGLCWQPTAVIVDPYWQPYFDNGSWVNSSAGWYWHSNYTWGWAPFHYGRWHRHPNRGWLWLPGATWGPAWVTWRYSNSYVGWAPLPPGVHYYDGFGLRFRTGSVGIGFDFGLSYAHYSFVPHHHFYGAAPWRHRLPRSRVRDIYHGTTIVNNYTQARDRSIIHHGPSRRLGASFSQPGVRNVTIRDIPLRNSGSVLPSNVRRSGADFVVNSPRLPSRTSPGRINARRQALRGTSSANSRSATSTRPSVGPSVSKARRQNAGNSTIRQPSSAQNVAVRKSEIPGASTTSISNGIRNRNTSTISRQSSIPSITSESVSRRTRTSQSISQNQRLYRTSPPAGRTSVAPLQRRERQSSTFGSRTIETPISRIPSRSTSSSSITSESTSIGRIQSPRSYTDPTLRSRTDSSRFGTQFRRSENVRAPATRQEIQRPSVSPSPSRQAISEPSRRQIVYPPSRSSNLRPQTSRSRPSTRRSSPQPSRSYAPPSRPSSSPSTRTAPTRRGSSSVQAPRTRSSPPVSRPSSSAPSRSSGSSTSRQSTRR